MRWSIRNQILIPLLAIQAAAVTAATVTMATLAVKRSEREIIGRLNDVVDTVMHGNFPYTESVLDRMRGLSGAHFIVAGAGGDLVHTSLPNLESLPARCRSCRPPDTFNRFRNRRPFWSRAHRFWPCRFDRRAGRRVIRCSSFTREQACSRRGGRP